MSMYSIDWQIEGEKAGMGWKSYSDPWVQYSNMLDAPCAKQAIEAFKEGYELAQPKQVREFPYFD